MPVSGVAAPPVRHPVAQLRIALALMLILPTLAAAAPAWAAAPSNDNLADAVELRGTSGEISGTITDATKETGETAYSGPETVWYKIALNADDTLVVHACTTVTTDLDFALQLWQTTDPASTTPAFGSEFSFLTSNDDFGGGSVPAISTRDCAGGWTWMPWVTVHVAEARMIWIQMGPNGTTGDFTLSWYVSRSNPNTDKSTGKLTVSRSDVAKCTVTVKGTGLDSFTWLRVSLSNGGSTTSLDYYRTNSRGVLKFSEDVTRSVFNSGGLQETAQIQDIEGSEVVPATTLTNRCSPAA